jgi:hypothetical protein
MNDSPSGTRQWISACILIGAGIFILGLVVSAGIVPELRLLHVLQGLIYVAVVALTRRNSPWGFGAGVTIATVWNCFNLFLTHLIQAGAGQLWQLLTGGHVSRPETLMVFVASIGHVVLIVGCVAGFAHLHPRGRHWSRFIGGAVLVLAYFALIVFIARPR